MLAAFDRYLAANASETAEEALQIIADNIDDGKPPQRAVVHARDDRVPSNKGPEGPEEVVGLQHIAETRAALRSLGQLLLEDPEHPEVDGGRTWN